MQPTNSTMNRKTLILCWHFRFSRCSKHKLILIRNMMCGHLGIMMLDFLLVYNIAPSSYTFLLNNLSLEIYDTFITCAKKINIFPNYYKCLWIIQVTSHLRAVLILRKLFVFAMNRLTHIY